MFACTCLTCGSQLAHARELAYALCCVSCVSPHPPSAMRTARAAVSPVPGSAGGTGDAGGEEDAAAPTPFGADTSDAASRTGDDASVAGGVVGPEEDGVEEEEGDPAAPFDIMDTSMHAVVRVSVTVTLATVPAHLAHCAALPGV